MATNVRYLKDMYSSAHVLQKYETASLFRHGRYVTLAYSQSCVCVLHQACACMVSFISVSDASVQMTVESGLMVSCLDVRRYTWYTCMLCIHSRCRVLRIYFVMLCMHYIYMYTLAFCAYIFDMRYCMLYIHHMSVMLYLHYIFICSYMYTCMLRLHFWHEIQRAVFHHFWSEKIRFALESRQSIRIDAWKGYFVHERQRACLHVSPSRCATSTIMCVPVRWRCCARKWKCQRLQESLSAPYWIVSVQWNVASIHSLVVGWKWVFHAVQCPRACNSTFRIRTASVVLIPLECVPCVVQGHFSQSKNHPDAPTLWYLTRSKFRMNS